LLQLYDGDEKYLGDAVAYSELNDGGKVLYVCFNLLEGPHSESLLYDVFDFIAARIGHLRKKLLLSGVSSLFGAGLLLRHSESFSTNYPPSVRFFTKPLQLSGNSGIILAGSRLN